MTKTIQVLGTQINYKIFDSEDYISLTDIAKTKNPDNSNSVIGNWMRNRMTVEYLGLWETLYNPNFKPIEFEGFRSQAGLNAFTLSPQQWIEKTSAIGIVSKSGKYGGTYAHRDIAFRFASWISVEFELYLVKEFQRLKREESKQLDWNAKRELAKINYKIHTDAISENLIVPQLTKSQICLVYASEADVLNVALFGRTAAEWRNDNPSLEGNMRDYATVEQLLIIANLESYNAFLIQQGVEQDKRLVDLNKMAISQMKALQNNKNKLLHS